MAYCANCGTQTSGSFCPNCGAATGGAAGAGTAGASYVPPGTPSAVQAAGITENVASALCYTPFLIGLIIDLVLLFLAPYSQNRTIRFNALQSLFLHAALFLMWVAIQIVFGIFAVATHGVGFLFSLGLYPIISLAIIVLFLVMMYKAYNNQRVKLPIIGDLAQKQA